MLMDTLRVGGLFHIDCLDMILYELLALTDRYLNMTKDAFEVSMVIG